MAHPIKILEPAQHELEEIAQLHMALAGPNSARIITDKIYAAIEQASLFPKSGYPIHDRALRQQGYRCLLAGKYIIFYRMAGDTVYIYHIVHGATDYPQLYKELAEL